MSKHLTYSLRTLVSGAGITFLFALVGYVLMFVFKVVAARYVGPLAFGQFTLAETILNVTAIIGSMGIAHSIPRYLPYYTAKNESERLAGYVRFIFRYPLLISGIFAAVLCLFSADITVFFNFPPSFALYIKLIALILPLRVMSNVIRNILLSQKKIVLRNVSYHVIERLLLMLGVIGLAAVDGSANNLIYILVAAIVSAFVFDVAAYITTIRYPTAQQALFEKKEWILFSLPLFLSGIFSFFIGWSDNLIIGKFLSAGDLGIYSIAFSMAMMAGFIERSFSVIFMPTVARELAKNNHETISFLFTRSSSLIFGLSLPVFLVMFLYAREIMVLVYGQAYEAGYVPLVIISIGYLVSMMTGLHQALLVAHKQTSYIFTYNLLFAGVNIGMNLFLIPVLGIVGAAIASAITLSTQNIVFLMKATTFETLTYDWKRLWRFGAAAFLAIAVAGVLFRLVLSGDGLAAYVISAILYCAVYALASYAFGALDHHDLDLIKVLQQKTTPSFMKRRS